MMIKMNKFKNTNWYIDAVEDLIIDRRSAEKRDNQLKQFYEEINNEMKKIFQNCDEYKDDPWLQKVTFKEIITLDYSSIKVIKKSLDKISLEDIFYKKVIDKNKKESKILLEPWDKIIKTYKKFSKQNINNKIIKESTIYVCPYCNRNFINNRSDSKTSAQLDHFYPKNKYPLFAISLYNLIPSCSACNHIKHEEEINISPYDEIYNFEKNYNITYTPKSVDYLENSDDIDISFKYKDNKNNSLKKNIDNMCIENAYKLHSDYVLELIKKSIVYNSSQLEELLFEFPEIFNSREEIINLIFGNYVEIIDFNKQPLARLTRDICDELGIKAN